MAACNDNAHAVIDTAKTTTSAAAPRETAAAPQAPQAPQATAAASATARPEAGIAGKILCFGDSITQADWPGKIKPDEKWVTVLQKKSDRITAVNAGRNGRTTAEGLAELPKALADNPDSAVVLFFLGVNDMKHARPGVVEKATSNLGKMVDMVHEKIPRAEVVIAAPINVNVDRLTPYFKGEEMGPDTVHYMKALRVAYEALARKKGVRFIDLLGVAAPADIEDGVHANGHGQAAIAEAVWKGLQR